MATAEKIKEIKERQRALIKAKFAKAGLAGKKKKCTDCGTLKTLDNFAAHDSSGDGHASVCNSCRNDRNNTRRKTVPEHRLKHHTAVRVQKQLGLACPVNYQKDLEKYLGYSMKDLSSKLEKELQDEEGISLLEAFDKGYHLDHIVPLHSFKVKHIESDAFKKCWAISNLKMIPAEVNLAKSGKMISHEEASGRI